MLEEYPDLLTVEDMARILRVHKNTVYVQLQRGELPSVKIGRRIYVPKKWLLDSLAVK